VGTAAATASSSSGAPLPCDAREHLAVLADHLDHMGEGARRVAPGHELLARIAHRVAGREATHAGSSRAAASATPPVRIDSASSPTAAAFCSAERPGSKVISPERPACCERVGTTRAGLSDSSAARSAARITLGLLGSTITSCAGRGVDAREDVVGRRVERGAAVDHLRVQARGRGRRSRPRWPRPPRPQRVVTASAAVARQPRVPFGHLLAHVGHVEVRHRAGGLEEAHRPLRLVGVHVDLERADVAHHEHGVAHLLEARDEARAVEAPGPRPRSWCST